MKPRAKHILSLATAFTLTACSRPSPVQLTRDGLARTIPQDSIPAPAEKSKPAPRLAASVEWFDGDTPHEAWVSRTMVAEFGPAEASKRAVLAAAPGSQVVAANDFVRIWKLESLDAALALSSLKVGRPAGSLSPVFHDGPSEQHSVRALPGGVLVRLQPDWTQAQVDQWLSREGLRSLQQIGAAPTWVLVDSDAGMPSLELANRLRRSPFVLSTTPNWWLQAQKR